MNKFLKLALIFVVLVAVIVGVMLIDPNKQQITTIPEDDTSMYYDVSHYIDSLWSKDRGWSWSSYEATKQYVEVRERDLGDVYRTCMDAFHVKALSNLYDSTVMSFSDTNCSRSSVAALRHDLDLLKQDIENIDKYKKVEEMESMHNVYERAYSLATKQKFFIDPHFDKKSGTWDSYKEYEDAILGRRTVIQHDAYFHYIENISQIVNGLGSLETKLNEGKGAFADKLSQEILDAYVLPDIPSSIDSSRIRSEKAMFEKYLEEFRTLIEVRDKYRSQFSDDDIGQLNRHLDNYGGLLGKYKEVLNAAENRNS